jgi:ABC-type glutathione transport system ATPase component
MAVQRHKKARNAPYKQTSPQQATRRNEVPAVGGGTSSGKTTLANLLMEFIPDHERIVLIEDTAEIQIEKENVLRFEARRDLNRLIPALSAYMGQCGLGSSERCLKLTPERFRKELVKLSPQRPKKRRWRDDSPLMKFLAEL